MSGEGADTGSGAECVGGEPNWISTHVRQPGIGTAEGEDRHRLLEAVIANSPVGIAILRVPDLVFEMVNPTLQSLAPDRPMLGRHFPEVWPEIAELAAPVIERVLSSGIPYSAADVPFQVRRTATSPPEPAYLTFTCVPLRDGAGRYDVLLAMVQNTTEQVRERKRAEALSQVVAELNAGGDFQEVVRTALTRATELLGGDDGSLFLFEADGRRLRGALELTAVDRIGTVVEIDGLPNSKRAVETRKPVYFTLPEAMDDEPEWLRRLGIRGAIVAPLPVGSRCIGLLYVNFRREGYRPSDDDLAFAEAIALRCALAIDRARDLEERARLLRESQRRAGELDAIIENMAEGVTIADATGKILRINAMGLKMLGFRSREEAYQRMETSRSFNARSIEGTPIPFEEGPLNRTLRGETVLAQEMKITADDGVDRVLLYSGSPIRNEQGDVALAINVYRDVTSQREAEAERERLLAALSRANEQLSLASMREQGLAESAEQHAAELQATISSIPVGVVIYDPSGEVVRMNAKAKDLLGCTAEETRVPSPPSVDRVQIETPQRKPLAAGNRPWARALRGETVQGAILVLNRLDGMALWISASASPIVTPEGAVLGAVAAFIDITPLHELQEQQEELIRTISHDLRNPLTPIIGQATLLQRMLIERGMEREARSVGAIATNARRMNGMIQDLVDSIRLEAAVFEMRKEPEDLCFLIADLSERVGAVEDRERLRVECPDWLPPVPADKERVERAITNLITNALKYSPADRPVVVRVERRDRKAVISVIDRGIGIPPEEQAHLFDRFRRAEAGRKYGGLGLGLYIARQIVEAHGGRIWVQSEPELGSTFSISLPMD